MTGIRMNMAVARVADSAKTTRCKATGVTVTETGSTARDLTKDMAAADTAKADLAAETLATGSSKAASSAADSMAAASPSERPASVRALRNLAADSSPGAPAGTGAMTSAG